MSRPETNPVAAARALATSELFPHALETDAGPLVSRARLDALADAGLYGIAAPGALGGLGDDPAAYCRVLEELASGCLTTAFVFAQHHGAVRTLARAHDAPARRWLEPLRTGAARAGAAFAGLRRPGPPLLVARRVTGGWVLDGRAPWVSGWGRIDLLHVAARTDDGAVLWSLVDAQTGPSLAAEPLELVAVRASGTVALDFCGLAVPEDRVSLLEPFATWQARDARGLRPNGSHALGVARRCAALLAESGVERAGLEDEIDRCRGALDGATEATIAAARAWASELALRARTLLVAAQGGRAVLLTSHAQRLAREALFLLVFGHSAPTRAALTGRLARPARVGNETVSYTSVGRRDGGNDDQ